MPAVSRLGSLAVLLLPLAAGAADPPTRVATAASPARPAVQLKRCAALDHHLLWLVEEHGAAGELADDDLAQAAFDVLAARRLCASGDFERGLDMYSNIPLGQPRTTWLR